VEYRASKASASRIRAVLFDFDYTLVDATEGNLECLNFALAAVGAPVAERAQGIAATGLSIRELLLRFHGGEVSETLHARFTQCFVARADEVMLERIAVYPEVPEVLRALRAQGLALGIVSTKYRRRLEGVLRRDGLADLFAVVVGGDDVEQHKPHPEGLERAARLLELEPAACLYVGDHAVDAEAAQRAGMHFAPVATGFTVAAVWQRFPKLASLTDTRELPPLLARIAREAQE
jgi:phosphoglycolate phosphatase